MKPTHSGLNHGGMHILNLNLNPKFFQTWSILAIFGVLSPKIILVFAHLLSLAHDLGFKKSIFQKIAIYNFF